MLNEEDLDPIHPVVLLLLAPTRLPFGLPQSSDEATV